MWLRPKGKRGHMDAKRPGEVSWKDSFRGRSGGETGESTPASSESGSKASERHSVDESSMKEGSGVAVSLGCGTGCVQVTWTKQHLSSPGSGRMRPQTG